MRRLAAVCLLAFASAAAAADLRATLDGILAGVPQGGRSSVVVYDLQNRQLLYSVRGGEQMTPASVAKLVVSAAALLELGPDWRFTTRLVASGAVADGAVPGLTVVGGGDPCLDTHFYSDPDEPFRRWAAALQARGVRRIDGDLVIDGSLFSGPIRPTTYPQDHENQQRWYSAPASAFAWNDNCLEVRLSPTQPGQPCAVQVRPRSPRVQVRNLARTAAAGKGDRAFVVNRDAAANLLTVSGQYGKPADWFALAIHSDPLLLAGDHLRAVFTDAGIEVRGRVIEGVAPAGGTVLVEDGHPLGPALQILNTNSQNFYGEQILRVLGVRRRQEGSIAAGCLAVEDILREKLGRDIAGWTLVDGCGLSYTNQACADFLARLLVQMDATPAAAAWRATLKVRTVGRARALVKSGTLDVARAYAGYVERPANRGRVAFVILLNRGDARAITWAITMRDRLLEAICNHS